MRIVSLLRSTSLMLVFGALFLLGCGTSTTTPPPGPPPPKPPPAKSVLAPSGKNGWYYGPPGLSATDLARVMIDNGSDHEITMTLPDQKSFAVKPRTRINLLLAPGAAHLLATSAPADPVIPSAADALAAPVATPPATPADDPRAIPPAPKPTAPPTPTPINDTLDFYAVNSGTYVYNPGACWDYIRESQAYGTTPAGADTPAPVEIRGTVFFKLPRVDLWFEPFPEQVTALVDAHGMGSSSRTRFDHIDEEPAARTVTPVELFGHPAWVCDMGDGEFAITTIDTTSLAPATLIYDPAGDPANLLSDGKLLIKTSPALTLVRLTPGDWHFTLNRGAHEPTLTLDGHWITGARHLWCPSGNRTYVIEYESYRASLGDKSPPPPAKTYRGLVDVNVATDFAVQPFPYTLDLSSMTTSTIKSRFVIGPVNADGSLHATLQKEFDAAVEAGHTTVGPDKIAQYDALLQSVTAAPDDLKIQFAQALAIDLTGQSSALNRYAEIASFDPPWATFHVRYAEVALKRGQAKIAVTEFQRAIALDPTLKNDLTPRLAAAGAH